MKSWTIFKSHIIPLAKMRLLLRPVMRSLIVPQYALECLKMPSGTIRENRTRWTQFAYFQSVNYSILFLIPKNEYRAYNHVGCRFCQIVFTHCVNFQGVRIR